jgi:solute carrier family 41
MKNVAVYQKLEPSFSFLLQVAILLYVAYVITYYFWSRNVDPDNSTIPYLTALGDFLGVMLLGITFEFIYLVGDKQLPT